MRSSRLAKLTIASAALVLLSSGASRVAGDESEDPDAGFTTLAGVRLGMPEKDVFLVGLGHAARATSRFVLEDPEKRTTWEYEWKIALVDLRVTIAPTSFSASPNERYVTAVEIERATRAVYASAPQVALTTGRGIGIDSTYDDIAARYGAPTRSSESANGTILEHEWRNGSHMSIELDRAGKTRWIRLSSDPK